MKRKRFILTIEVEADALVIDVLRNALQGERVRRAMRLHLTKAVESVLSIVGADAFFVHVVGGALSNGEDVEVK